MSIAASPPSTRPRLAAALLTLGTACTVAACGPSADTPFTVPGLVAPPTGLVEQGKLMVAVPDEMPPYAFRDKGVLQGFSVDLAHEMARRMNLQAQLVTVPAAQILDGARDGSVDLAIGLTPIPRTGAPTGATLVPYILGGTEVLVRSGEAFAPEQLVELCTHSVVVVAGTRQESLLTGAASQCGPSPPQITRAGDDRAAVRALQDGSVDAYLADSGTAAFDKARDGGLLTSSGELDSVELGVALADTSMAATDTLRRVLVSIRADGSYEVLVRKWGLEKNSL